MARSLCGWTFGWHTESKGIAMADVGFTGIHHIKLPVSDLARSREWHERVLAYSVDREFPDGDGVVRGVAVRLPGAGVPLALRHNAQAAAGNAGFDPVSFAISDRAAAEDWAAHFDALGERHSEIRRASRGCEREVVHVLDPRWPAGPSCHPLRLGAAMRASEHQRASAAFARGLEPEAVTSPIRRLRWTA